jgi:hypothetical protein
MADKEPLIRALAEGDPITSLRNIAIEWSRSGMGKKAIYRAFYELYKDLQDQERIREEDLLGDAMDMIMDTYPGNNLYLPEVVDQKTASVGNDDLEKALADEDPVSALRKVAVDWSKTGLGRKEIYRRCLEYFCILQDSNRHDELARLGDVMDMISDSFAPGNPNNLNLPQE